MIYIIGIDPGKHGAIAILLAADSGTVTDYRVLDTPITEDGELDMLAVAEILASVPSTDSIATIERVNSFAGEGHMGAFRFGANYGAWLGLLAGSFIPCERVLPREWQRMVLPPETIFAKRPKSGRRNKQSSLDLARKLFPEVDLRLKKHDGRAEALLIAEYGRRKYRFNTIQAGRWNAVKG